MAKYFSKCRTAEELKKEYHKLAKQFHSDAGGNDHIMAEINAEYTTMWDRLKNIHFSQKTNTTYEETDERKKTTETPEQFFHIIQTLVNLNLEIEICGTWLWITGNTYPVRQQLTALGCRWSKGKKKWYYTEAEYRRFNKTLTMNQIRFRYGSQVIDTDALKRKQLT